MREAVVTVCFRKLFYLVLCLRSTRGWSCARKLHATFVSETLREYEYYTSEYCHRFET